MVKDGLAFPARTPVSDLSASSWAAQFLVEESSSLAEGISPTGCRLGSEEGKGPGAGGASPFSPSVSG